MLTAMKTKFFLLPVLFLVIGFIACNSDYSARPRGYFRIDLPEKKYQVFSRPGFPYTFEYPVYGEIVQDSLFFDQAPENPYWINIDFPQFDGKIHISYKEIGRNNFDSLVSDANNMAYKQHTYKASAIQKEPFHTPSGNGGIYFTLKG